MLGKLSGLRSELTATALEGINPADAHRLLEVMAEKVSVGADEFKQLVQQSSDGAKSVELGAAEGPPGPRLQRWSLGF